MLVSLQSLVMLCWQGPQIEQQYEIKNNAAIPLQRKSNVKFKTAKS